jgi:hypothetical protein
LNERLSDFRDLKCRDWKKRFAENIPVV